MLINSAHESNDTDMVIVGMDLGASKLHAVLIDNQKQILTRRHVLLEDRREHYLEKLIVEILDDILSKENVSTCNLMGLGLAIPGYIDTDRGILLNSSNLYLKEWNAKENLSKILGIPIMVENDVNAAALGEFTFGLEKSVSHLLFVNVGSGVGMGIIINKAIFRGDFGLAGELGHIVVDTQGPPCTCGNRGCLEAYAGGTGISNRYLNYCEDTSFHQQEISAKVVNNLARKGNTFAQRAIYEGVGKMGLAVANIINLFSIRDIVFGGGVVEEDDKYLDLVNEQTKQYVIPDLKDRYRIQKSILGPDAGALGSCTLVGNLK